jgi:hypothetical protein
LPRQDCPRWPQRVALSKGAITGHSLPASSRAQVIRTTSKGENTRGIASLYRASRPRHDVAIGWPCGIHEHRGDTPCTGRRHDLEPITGIDRSRAFHDPCFCTSGLQESASVQRRRRALVAREWANKRDRNALGQFFTDRSATRGFRPNLKKVEKVPRQPARLPMPELGPTVLRAHDLSPGASWPLCATYSS